MKISIISDTHFGYKWGEEREEDTFENAREAFEKNLDSDLIILPGDIFDRKIPRQEVLDNAADILSIAMDGERTVKPDRDLGMHGNGIPLVAIHGTHERRPESYTNPIELMDNTGHLYHLHNDRVEFEKDGEKVVVHGMSGVPEKYAPKVLEKFNPEPVEDAFNILVLHQSIEGFVYTGDGEHLKLEDLPEGFDLIIDGHIHWYNIERFPGEKPLVFPGSTVTTQMRKVEAEKSKGFLRLDTEEEELEFEPLEKPRKVFYIEIDADGREWKKVKKEILEELKDIDAEKKPLVNLKITGEVEGRVNPREIKDSFESEFFLNVNSSLEKNSSKSGSGSIESVDTLKQGKKLLGEKVENSLEVDEDQFFQLLEQEKSSDAFEKLREEVEK